jgi:mannosyltransferase
MGSSPVRRSSFPVRAILQKGLFPAILLASILLRLINLGKQGLWFDETYTAYVAQQPSARMIQFLISDGVHPPLYYGFMAVWIRLFGASAWSLRLPSAICGALAVWVLYLLVRRMAGESEAILSAVLLGASPFLLWYSQDARMYSMECLAAVTAVFFFWSYLHKPALPGLIGLILSHAVLYGLHYFGVFLLMTECVFLLFYWREYIRLWVPFLIAQTLAILPLIVWGSILLQRENGSFGIGWIPKTQWMDPILTLLNFFTASGGTWNLFAAAAGLALVCLFGLTLRSGRYKEAVGFGFFWLFFPILMAWILSQRIPIYIDRYLILSLPAAVVLASIGAASVHGSKRFILPILLLGSMLPGLWNLNLPANEFQKEGWRAAAESIRMQYQTGDVILIRVYQEAVPFHYYGLLDLAWVPIETNNVVELPGISPSVRRYFIVCWVPSQSAHSFGTANPDAYNETNPLVKEWMDHTLRLLWMENRYHGVVILVMEPVKP